MMLTEDEIPKQLIRDTRIFHFGTLSMTLEGVRAATKKAIDIANAAASIITTRKGALRVMPTLSEIEQVI